MNRRRLLQAATGLSISLPWLEAFAAPKAPVGPTRLAFLFMPNGVNPNTWSPSGDGKNFTLSPVLKPLEPLRQDVTIFSNLRHAGADNGDGHYAKTANFLSGLQVHQTTGKDLRCGVSADQIAARHIGTNSVLPSVELAIEPTRFGIDSNVGFTQIYGGHIAWNSPTTPMPKEIHPRLAFDRLFGRSLLSTQASVLDEVSGDARDLNAYLGREDRARLDEFLTSLRALELRISRQSSQTTEDFSKLPQPAADQPKSLEEHMRLMLDLIVLAFQMNRTRVATFMFGNSVSGLDFSFLKGVEGSFHEISHHGNKPEKLAMYSRINEFHVQLYADMLQKMKSIKEGDQTLLDQSLILLGCGMRDGNGHVPINLPILVAGHAGGVRGGQHLNCPENTPFNRLHLSLLQKVGVPITSFGDSGTQPLDI